MLFQDWNKEFEKFWPEHWNFYFNGLLLGKVYIVWTKKSRQELSFMTLKSDAKFEKKLTCCLENDMRNLANFHQSTQKCQNWNFDGIILPKVENLWPYNLQSSYVSWQWRMIQKLKRNWLVVLKLTWGTSQILTRALERLKNLCFNWLLVTKVYIAWATEIQRSYLSWHWRDMQIFKKNWLLVWKKTWEIWQIFTRALESVKIGTMMVSFCPK